MAKGIVKETKKRYKNSRGKKVLKAIGGTFLGISLSALIAMSAYTLSLPRLNSKEEANNFLVSNGYNADYDNINTILKNTYTATTPPILSDRIKLNIAIDDLSGEQIADMQAVVEEFNFVFSVINPKYKFELNFHPTVADFLNPEYITVRGFNDIDDYSRKSSNGYARKTVPFYNKSGFSAMYQLIALKYKSSSFNMRYVITHELLHCLGIGDAYTFDQAPDVPTVMNNSKFLRKNDIALLASKYGDYSTPEKEAQLKLFIENYEQNTEYGQEILTQQLDLYEKLQNNLSSTIEQNPNSISFQLPKELYVIKNKSQLDATDFYLARIEEDKLLEATYKSESESDKVIHELNALQIENAPSVDISYFSSNNMQNSYLLFIRDNQLYRASLQPDKETLDMTSLGTIVDKETYLQLEQYCDILLSCDGETARNLRYDNIRQTVEEVAQKQGLLKNQKEEFLNEIFIDKNGTSFLFKEDGLYDQENKLRAAVLYTDYGVCYYGEFLANINEEGNVVVYMVDYTTKSIRQYSVLSKEQQIEME